MEFLDQVALVTGGNTGIGRAIALRLAEEGAKVILAARNRERGEAVCQQIAVQGGKEAKFFSLELGQVDAVQDLLRTVDREYGALHVLINNAGGGDYAMPGGNAAALLETWNRQMSDNLLSAYLVTSFAVEIMRRTGGAVVNTSSTASLHGTYGLYGTMKAGLEGLTRGMACTYAPLGIRANAVAPGWIKTYPLPFADDPAILEWEKTASLLGRMGQAEEVAEAVLFLASGKASFITGTTLFVDGGLSINDPTNEGLTHSIDIARRRT
jgi:meso-butanediol dehydrogenase/(S,S)-butanediol dehydrogenase/diacetyl reductase